MGLRASLWANPGSATVFRHFTRIILMKYEYSFCAGSTSLSLKRKGIQYPRGSRFSERQDFLWSLCGSFSIWKFQLHFLGRIDGASFFEFRENCPFRKTNTPERGLQKRWVLFWPLYQLHEIEKKKVFKGRPSQAYVCLFCYGYLLLNMRAHSVQFQLPLINGELQVNCRCFNKCSATKDNSQRNLWGIISAK